MSVDIEELVRRYPGKFAPNVGEFIGMWEVKPLERQRREWSGRIKLQYTGRQIPTELRDLPLVNPTDPVLAPAPSAPSLIEVAQRYPCELSSLPYLDMIEMEAFRRGDDASRRWVRRRIDAIEFLGSA